MDDKFYSLGQNDRGIFSTNKLLSRHCTFYPLLLSYCFSLNYFFPFFRFFVIIHM